MSNFYTLRIYKSLLNSVQEYQGTRINSLHTTLDALNRSYVGCYKSGEWTDLPRVRSMHTLDCIKGSSCRSNPEGVRLIGIRIDYCDCIGSVPEDQYRLPEERCHYECPDGIPLTCGGGRGAHYWAEADYY